MNWTVVISFGLTLGYCLLSLWEPYDLYSVLMVPMPLRYLLAALFGFWLTRFMEGLKSYAAGVLLMGLVAGLVPVAVTYETTSLLDLMHILDLRLLGVIRPAAIHGLSLSFVAAAGAAIGVFVGSVN